MLRDDAALSCNNAVHRNESAVRLRILQELIISSEWTNAMDNKFYCIAIDRDEINVN